MGVSLATEGGCFDWSRANPVEAYSHLPSSRGRYPECEQLFLQAGQAKSNRRQPCVSRAKRGIAARYGYRWPAPAAAVRGSLSDPLDQRRKNGAHFRELVYQIGLLAVYISHRKRCVCVCDLEYGCCLTSLSKHFIYGRQRTWDMMKLST